MTDEVRKLDGVTDVDVDLASGTVQVTSDAPLDEAELHAAIDEAGYEVIAFLGVAIGTLPTVGSLAAVLGGIGIAYGATKQVSRNEHGTTPGSSAKVRSEGGHHVIDAA